MRWIRLDTTWSHSAWLSVLSAESRLAWVELLCHVKSHGSCGRTRALCPDRFARMIEVGEESVRKMLKAAEMDGALTLIENDWLITKWAKYQGDETGAERQRRFKENRKPNSGNGGNALLTAVTVTMTETETVNPIEVINLDKVKGDGSSSDRVPNQSPPKTLEGVSSRKMDIGGMRRFGSIETEDLDGTPDATRGARSLELAERVGTDLDGERVAQIARLKGVAS